MVDGSGLFTQTLSYSESESESQRAMAVRF